MSSSKAEFLFVILMILNSKSRCDEFMSCDRFYESERKARILKDIPCDMGSSMYCERKGSSYPEAAIWRFKEENRALMKRMYGDLESGMVFRQMRSSKLDHHDIFSSLQYDIRVGSGFKKESKLIKKVIRKKIVVVPDVVTSSSSSTTPMRTTTTTTTTTTTIASTKATTQKGSPVFSTSETSPMTTTTTIRETRTTTSTTISPFNSSEIDIDYNLTTSTPSYTSTTEEDSTTTTTSGTTVAQELNLTTYYTPPIVLQRMSTVPGLEEADVSTVDISSNDDQEPPWNSTTNSLIFHTESSTKASIINESANDSPEDLEDGEELFETIFEVPNEGNEYDYDAPSVNACPVKEEVLAPFWANNTRDQVLALLNLYPFEQYIHMETCQFENEQRLCRSGCKCEQQYRLHRLLAFDPSNECRGIFSDWFRFPSFCVCKCYPKKQLLSNGKFRRKPRDGGELDKMPPRKKK